MVPSPSASSVLLWPDAAVRRQWRQTETKLPSGLCRITNPGREEGVMGGTPFGILGRSAPESVANNSAPKSSGSIYKPTAPFSRSLYSRSLVPKNRKRLFAIFAECVHYCSDQGRWIRDDLITIDSRSILPQQSSQGSRLNWWLYRESQPALSFPNQARLNDAPPPSKPKSAARKRLVKA
jgi:hypothetical protein